MEMEKLATKYKEELELSSLKLSFSARRGFYVSMDAKSILSQDAKKLFIQLSHQTKKITCSTQELQSLNSRIKDIQEEIYLLTDTCVYN